MQNDGVIFPGWLPCADAGSPCVLFSHAPYSTFAGIPLASFGVIYFLWAIVLSLSALIARYAATALVGLLSFFSAVTFGVDIVQAIELVRSGILCELCIAAFIINILILFFLILLIRNLQSRGEWPPVSGLKDLLSRIGKPENRFATLLLFVVLFMITVSVLAGTTSLRYYSDVQSSNRSLMRVRVDGFMTLPKISQQFPQSIMSKGSPDAKIRIAVFTDLFCPSCMSFYNIEDEILSRNGSRIAFDHYFLPLDPSCNDAIKGKGHQYSCEASGYLYAAAQRGFYDDFIREQRHQMEKMNERYAQNHTASQILRIYLPKAPVDELASVAASDDARKYIRRDVDLAHLLNVRSTPTIFVGGRRTSGPFSVEYIEQLVAASSREQ
jgi:uncharacterized membrane protein